MIEIMAAQLTPTPITYVFVGTIIAMIGVILIVYTFASPIINIIGSIVGWILIVAGGFTMIYGVAPQIIPTIGAIVGAVIWIIGIIIIVWHEWTAIKKV